jgi:hypothetical protein
MLMNLMRMPVRLLVFAVALSLSVVPVKADDSDCACDNNPARIKSAQDIILKQRKFINHGLELIAQAENGVEQAKVLQGEAKSFKSLVKPRFKPMKGAQLAAARKQYQVDLAQFAKHAKAYHEHTKQIRLTAGECEASKKVFEQLSKEYNLHCDDFHLPDIPPPHICLELGTTQAEANQVVNKVRESLRRIALEENKLAASEQRLSNANAMSGTVDAHVRKQHDLNLKEQELVAEYGRLREEHRQLGVEKQALTASGIKTGVATVSAKVRPSKK